LLPCPSTGPPNQGGFCKMYRAGDMAADEAPHAAGASPTSRSPALEPAHYIAGSAVLHRQPTPVSGQLILLARMQWRPRLARGLVWRRRLAGSHCAVSSGVSLDGNYFLFNCRRSSLI
jgi:hypothetical protein